MSRACVLLGALLACGLFWAGPARAEEHRISQRDKTFSRSEMTVRRGDEVVFSNDDKVTHNLYSVSSGNEFEIKTQPPGTSRAVSFRTPGSAEVRCAIHPTMKLAVHVDP